MAPIAAQLPMTGEPRPRYNALQLLGESEACDQINEVTCIYVVRDLFPAGPISVIFVLYASISCNCNFSS